MTSLRDVLKDWLHGLWSTRNQLDPRAHLPRLQGEPPMSVYTNGPRHERAKRRRPTFTRTTAADRSRVHFGRLRSSCGHTLGIAAIWRGRQWVIQWASCR
jgi:hypothetical protein